MNSKQESAGERNITHSSLNPTKQTLRKRAEQAQLAEEKLTQFDKKQKEIDLRKERALRRQKFKETIMPIPSKEDQNKISTFFGAEVEENVEKSDEEDILGEENQDTCQEQSREEKLVKAITNAFINSQLKDIGKLKDVEPFGDNTSTRNLEQFLREYEDVASAKQWSDKDKRNFLKHYLKNPAREFYERIPLSERKVWGKLKNYLRAFFLSPQQAFCAKYELQKMTQLEKESIAEFVARLSTKAKQAFPNDPHLTTQAAKEEIKQALAYHSAPYLRRKMAKLLATGVTLDKMIEKSTEEEIFHLQKLTT